MHPASARALVSFLEDAMLTGHAETAAGGETSGPRALLGLHLEAVKAAASRSGADLEWHGLHSELEALRQRIEGPYDYFGNPAGWVPMLSFQANLRLYTDEVKAAVPTMFLAYWVENHQKREQKVYGVLKEAMERLRKETQQAIETYDAAQAKLIGLDERSDSIKSELNDRKTDLEQLIKRRKQETKDNLKVEHFWRAPAKIVGGILQLIPVGQPVLGAISGLVLAVHGCEGDEGVVFVGGRNDRMKGYVLEALQVADFKAVEDFTSHAGREARNICNRGGADGGVQLEIAEGLRRSMFQGLSRAQRRVTTPVFDRFVDSVRGVLAKACVA